MRVYSKDVYKLKEQFFIIQKPKQIKKIGVILRPSSPEIKDQFLSVSDPKKSCISEESKWPKLKPQPEKPAFEESISFQAHLLSQKETLKYLNHKDFLA